MASATSSADNDGFADTLETVERRITASTAFETTPTLGNDGTTDLVVFTMRPYINGNFGAGDIWYQPLVGGAPSGMPVQVTSGPIDDQLNDVSGDYIVYTAFDSVTLYGEDPDQRPDIWGKVGESGVSICTVEDMERVPFGDYGALVTTGTVFAADRIYFRIFVRFPDPVA